MAPRTWKTHAAAIALLGALPAGAATITVTNTDDSGTGSLRWAISQANLTAEPDTIVFSLPGSGVRVIALASTLPSLGYPTTIDGTTASSGGTTPPVRIDGQNDGAIGWGLDVGPAAAGSTIRGLQIVRMAGTGIRNWANGLTVRGSYIGTDGIAAQANSGDGIASFQSTGLVVGGSSISDRNVISGNGGNGIMVVDSSSGATITGNYVGISALGGTAIPNLGDGIRIAGDGVTVGGTSAGLRNVISGNGYVGVHVDLAADAVAILGNYIGTGVTGALPMPNGASGIHLEGSGATVGGAAAGAGNVISGNLGHGVMVAQSASGTALLGNRIGTVADGSSAIGNGADGIAVYGAGTVIGGIAAGAANTISGNAYIGIAVRTESSATEILGNRIGTNEAGSAAVGNGAGGIYVQGSGATIGGAAAGAGNLISGNSADGIVLDSDSHDNVVLGNLVGTNAAGSAPLANAYSGIVLYGSANTIGGTSPGEGNVVSGNTSNGIGIYGDGSGNQIVGNRIGTNPAGTGAVGNGGYGIRVVAGSATTIGGPDSGAGNLISGNGRGLSLEYDAHDYVVQGNVIGLNASATAKLANHGSGIEIFSPGHLIGGGEAGAANVIAGNDYSGVVLGAGTTGVQVQGNYIGTNAADASGLGNSQMGITVTESFANTIGGTGPGEGNVIARNGYLGIYVWSGDRTSILGNSIHDNTLLGIDLDPQGPVPNDSGDGDAGPNHGQNFPVVTTAELAGDLEIEGYLDSTPSSTFRVELFSNPSFDPTGIGEGRNYLGFVDVVTDAGGHGAFSVSLPPAGGDAFVTATATAPLGDTSEFSPAIAVGAPQAGKLQIWRDLLLSYEGTPGLEIAIIRSHGTAGTVAVDVATLDDTAHSPADFGAVDTTLTFGPGEVLKSIFVPIVTDGIAEGDEKWYLQLADPQGGATLGTQSVAMAWLFDATLDYPMYTIGDATLVEGDGGSKKAVFTVTLSPTDHDVPIEYWTSDGTATGGDDYATTNGQIVFHPGDTSQTIEIDVLGDTVPEPDELFYVHLYGLAPSVSWDGLGDGRILDDDGGSGSLIFAGDFESGDSYDWSASTGAP